MAVSQWYRLRMFEFCGMISPLSLPLDPPPPALSTASCSALDVVAAAAAAAAVADSSERSGPLPPPHRPGGLPPRRLQRRVPIRPRPCSPMPPLRAAAEACSPAWGRPSCRGWHSGPARRSPTAPSAQWPILSVAGGTMPRRLISSRWRWRRRWVSSRSRDRASPIRRCSSIV